MGETVEELRAMVVEMTKERTEQTKEMTEMTKVIAELQAELKRLRSPSPQPPRKRKTPTQSQSLEPSQMEVVDETGFEQVQSRKSKKKSSKKIPLVQTEEGLLVLDPTFVSPLPEGRKEAEVVITEKKAPRPPPIIIRSAGAFKLAHDLARSNNIEVREFKDCADGLKVFVESVDDFRKLSAVYRQSNLKFHLFQLKEEQQLHLVIRGVPQELAIDELEEDLKEQGFVFDSLARMKRGGRSLPLLALTAPRTDDGRRCYHITHVMRKRVQVETKRKQVGGSQCYRCQRFGHTASRCFGEVRCAFCLGDHPTRECSLERGPGKAASCVNCDGGSHPSFSVQCPNHPLMVIKRKEEEKKRRLLLSERRSGVSYAGVAGQGAQQPRAAQSVAPTPATNTITPAQTSASDLEGLIQRIVSQTLSKMIPIFLGSNGQ